MKSQTYDRVQSLAATINELQAAIGRADLLTAQHFAAWAAAELEDWQLALLHIPPTERSRYVSANPYVNQRSL
ncbi:hypothetical protein VRO62_002064 [Pseudomonas aeruginosa]|uniref:hypothetical protein n=1 Tax=Pseudomonas aeruginosa TaxID=287 RepID=UPI001ADF5314|nr:hypothetical protein [Pseudomonas aeruginosa]EMD6027068.1 hypothetical protein [Pseudomonas aeruginosa]MCK1827252.1 hypothetical protein [Pseudomonas aeruginosa]HDV4147662.1 hypothetical protein [Pseudomonas aeruginosa]